MKQTNFYQTNIIGFREINKNDDFKFVLLEDFVKSFLVTNYHFFFKNVYSVYIKEHFSFLCNIELQKTYD